MLAAAARILVYKKTNHGIRLVRKKIFKPFAKTVVK